MLVEAVILDGHERILQFLRNLRDLDRAAVLCRMDICYLVTIDIIDLRRCRWQYITSQIGLRIHTGGQEPTAYPGYHDQDNQAES